MRKMELGQEASQYHMELGPLPCIYESLCLMCFYYYIYILAPRNVNRDKEAEVFFFSFFFFFFFKHQKLTVWQMIIWYALNSTIVSNSAHLNE